MYGTAEEKTLVWASTAAEHDYWELHCEKGRERLSNVRFEFVATDLLFRVLWK